MSYSFKSQEYRQARFVTLQAPEISPDDCENLGLAHFKFFEYLIRTIRHTPELLPESNVILSRGIRLMRPASQLALLKALLKFRKSMKEDPVRNSKYSLIDLQQMVRKGKADFASVLTENFSKNSNAFPAFSELKDVFLKLLESDFVAAIRLRPKQEDVLAERLQLLCDVFRLGEIESEILLSGFLRKTDPGVEGLYSALEELALMLYSRVGHMRGHKWHGSEGTGVMAKLLGYSQGQINSVLAKQSAMMRLNLLDEDREIAPEVKDYLEGRGTPNIQENYFRQFQGQVLPLESHTPGREETTLLLELLRSHKGSRPLHILLHGMEGTGKTEFSRSLGAASGREVFEVGCDLDNSLSGEGGKTLIGDSVIRYRLRALQAAAFFSEGKNCLLVLDEADTLINNGEKGMLNQLMERIQTPTIWISNDVLFVQPSTRRRFDYSIEFRKLRESQRKILWDRILEKHGATQMVPPGKAEEFARRFPAVAGGIELAVRNAKEFAAEGSTLTPMRVMERVLQSHGKLLDYTPDHAVKTARSPSYSLEGLNIKGDMREILQTTRAFDGHWKAHDPASGPCNLTMLLYGPPGTGKTEFARYLARELDRPLLVKRASDLLDSFVGMTERNIREACEEAKDEGGILFLDEADSFLQSREGARNSWEVTQVNELLSGMENMTGMLVCSTNFEGKLDPASRRRFHLKLEFGYLKGDGARHFWKVFFDGNVAKEPGEKFFRELCALPLLAPGDFKAVYERMRFFPKREILSEVVMRELMKEIAFKDGRAGRKLGL